MLQMVLPFSGRRVVEDQREVAERGGLQPALDLLPRSQEVRQRDDTEVVAEGRSASSSTGLAMP